MVRVPRLMPEAEHHAIPLSEIHDHVRHIPALDRHQYYNEAVFSYATPSMHALVMHPLTYAVIAAPQKSIPARGVLRTDYRIRTPLARES